MTHAGHCSECGAPVRGSSCPYCGSPTGLAEASARAPGWRLRLLGLGTFFLIALAAYVLLGQLSRPQVVVAVHPIAPPPPPGPTPQLAPTVARLAPPAPLSDEVLAPPGPVNLCPKKGCPVGLESYWRFEGGAGTDFCGVNEANIRYATSVPGMMVGDSLLFDGVKDYVFMGSRPTWALGDAAFSFLFWMKGTGRSSAYNGHDFVLVLGARPPDDLEFVISHGGQYPFGSGDNLWLSLDYQNPSYRGFNADSGVALGETWHFIALVKAGDRWRLFIDGVPRVDREYPFYPSAANLSFGAHLSPDRYFRGQLDELAVFRRALSEEEIRTLYNGGRGRPYCGG